MNPQEDPNNPSNWTGAQFEDGGGMTFNQRVPEFGGMSNGGGAAAMSPGGGSPMAPPNPYEKKAESYLNDAETQFNKKQDILRQPRQQMSQQMSEVMNDPAAAHAHMQKVQDAPKPEDYRKYSMEFAGAMAVLGALAGKFTRNAGNASLNAFGAALKGWQEGNLEAYSTAAKEWEQNAKKTIENNQMELDKYKMIIEDRKLNIEQMSAAMTIASSEVQDKIMFDRAMAKDFTGIANVYDKRVANQEKLQATTNKLVEVKNNHDEELRGKIEEYNKNPSAYPDTMRINLAGAAKHLGMELAQPQARAPGQPPPGVTKEQFDYMADQYNAVGPSTLSNLGYGKDTSAIKRAIVEHAADRAMGAGQTGAEVATGRADFKSLGTALTALEKQKAAIGQFENTAIKNGDYLVQLANKVDKTGVPVIERWSRAGRQNLAGDPDVSTFNAQLRAYSNEVAKIITSPNLTGVLSDNARREAQSFLPEQASAKQIKAVVELFKRDFNNRKSSIDQEIASVKSQMGGKGGAAPASGDDGWTVKEK